MDKKNNLYNPFQCYPKITYVKMKVIFPHNSHHHHPHSNHGQNTMEWLYYSHYYPNFSSYLIINKISLIYFGGSFDSFLLKPFSAERYPSAMEYGVNQNVMHRLGDDSYADHSVSDH